MNHQIFWKCFKPHSSKTKTWQLHFIKVFWKIRNFYPNFFKSVSWHYWKTKAPEFHLKLHKKVKERAPAGIYLFKVNYRNTRTRCEICSKLTIKTPERHQWCRSGVFIVNFEHILHLEYRSFGLFGLWAINTKMLRPASLKRFTLLRLIFLWWRCYRSQLLFLLP